ncbi:unnamed protein product, partial [Mesocestoides corti]
ASPTIKSVVSTHKWDPPPHSRPGRHGRRSLSPPLPPPAEPVPETRRVLLKRKASTSVEQEGSNFAARSMKDFLQHQEDASAQSASAKRQRSSVVVVPPATSQAPAFDRREVCPILVRVFYSTDGRHTPLSYFSNGKFPPSEVQVNTWLNVSLRELSQEVIHAVKSSGTSNRRPALRMGRPMRFHFTSVFPDPGQRGAYRRRELGSFVMPTSVFAEQEEKSGLDDGDITLSSKHFQIGDYVDVAISAIGYDAPRGPFGEVDRRSRGNDRTNYDKRLQEKNGITRY